MLLTRSSRTLSTTLTPIFRPTTRASSTLASNPHIHIFPHPTHQNAHLLTLLPTTPPHPDLALGSTIKLPPTPDSFTENHHFLLLLQDTVSKHAIHDPVVKSQAEAFASQGGAGLGSGGVFFPQNAAHGNRSRTPRRSTGGGGGAGGGGAGGASAQGGMGGAGVGGWVHVADQRNPPDWGRVAWPEDILGSLQVNGHGKFVGEYGGYQSSGTYRIVTNEGILGLSPYLREKVTERLEEIGRHMKR